MFIDSHAHLTDTRLLSEIEKVRALYLSNGVTCVLDVGHSIQSSIQAKKNAQTFEEVYYSVGLHPDVAGSVDKTSLDKLIELSSDKKCLAIGEIGLDYHYLDYSKEVQLKAFTSQLELAIKLKKPVIIHSRDACCDTVNILKEYSSELNGFLMHCYSYSKETAKTLLDLGAYFSFGGVVTFKNAKKEDIIKSIPQSRILLETDCPYMAPVPFRGTINKPEYMPYIYNKVASIYGETLSDFCATVKNNFETFFKI